MAQIYKSKKKKKITLIFLIKPFPKFLLTMLMLKTCLKPATARFKITWPSFHRTDLPSLAILLPAGSLEKSQRLPPVIKPELAIFLRTEQPHNWHYGEHQKLRDLGVWLVGWVLWLWFGGFLGVLSFVCTSFSVVSLAIFATTDRTSCYIIIYQQLQNWKAAKKQLTRTCKSKAQGQEQNFNLCPWVPCVPWSLRSLKLSCWRAFKTPCIFCYTKEKLSVLL